MAFLVQKTQADITLLESAMNPREYHSPLLAYAHEIDKQLHNHIALLETIANKDASIRQRINTMTQVKDHVDVIIRNFLIDVPCIRTYKGSLTLLSLNLHILRSKGWARHIGFYTPKEVDVTAEQQQVVTSKSDAMEKLGIILNKSTLEAEVRMICADMNPRASST
jgi:hypothetical protein